MGRLKTERRMVPRSAVYSSQANSVAARAVLASSESWVVEIVGSNSRLKPLLS